MSAIRSRNSGSAVAVIAAVVADVVVHPQLYDDDLVPGFLEKDFLVLCGRERRGKTHVDGRNAAGEGRLADVLAQRAHARIAASAAARTAAQPPSADAAVKLLLRALQSSGGQSESDGLGLGVGG